MSIDSKITFVIERLSSGGAERVTSVLANYFVLNGFQVEIIVFDSSLNEYNIDSRIKKTYIKLKSYNKNLLSIYNISTLRKTLINSHTNYVISLATPKTNTLLFISTIFLKLRLILSERNSPKYYPTSKKIRMFRLIGYLFASRVVFQTEDAKLYFPRHIQNKGRIIPNPIHENLPDRFLGERTHTIVNFCRLSPQKNIKLLIDAFVDFNKAHKDYHLKIIGDGPQRNELNRYISTYNMENHISLIPNSPDVHELVKDSMMFVSSSDYEGISNSMLEAMAMGLPTISTDCPAGGAKKYIVSGQNGLLVPVNDKQALSNAMALIADNPDIQDKFSLNSMRIREELSQNQIFSMWRQLIAEIP